MFWCFDLGRAPCNYQSMFCSECQSSPLCILITLFSSVFLSFNFDYLQYQLAIQNVFWCFDLSFFHLSRTSFILSLNEFSCPKLKMYPSLEEEEEATWERGGLLREIFGGVLMAVYGACIHHHGYMPLFYSQVLGRESPVALTGRKRRRRGRRRRTLYFDLESFIFQRRRDENEIYSMRGIAWER